VTHRDIKLENIIIDTSASKSGSTTNNTIKLIDFGFCCCTTPDTMLKVFCGTPSYMSPEIVMKKEYSGPPTDIWASGILLFALLCGQFPFKGSSDKDLYKKISRGIYNPMDHLTHETRSFLNRMLVVDTTKRATASELLNDPWLRGISSHHN
jgi:MAP/microtubule affinity-regulating kinase